MKCIYRLGAGRLILAKRNIQAGEEFFSELPYVLAPIAGPPGAKRSICMACALPLPTSPVAGTDTSGAALNTSSSSVRCAKCTTPYCSIACQQAHERFHHDTFECPAIAATNAHRDFVSKEDFNTFQVVSLVAARCMSEGHAARLLKVSDERALTDGSVETVGLNQDALSPDALSAALESMVFAHDDIHKQIEALPDGGVPDPALAAGAVRGRACEASYDLVESLVTNLGGITQLTPEIVSDYQKVFKIYAKMVSGRRRPQRSPPPPGASQDATPVTSPPESPVGTGAGPLPPNPNGVRHDDSSTPCWWRPYLPPMSEDVFLALCGAFQCNGFGVWNTKAQQTATAFFPGSSFFNHSCAPNVARKMVGRRLVFYALKPIAAGAEFGFSYIDPLLDHEERQDKLRATYTFRCLCERCRDRDPDHKYLYDVAMCTDCRCKVLQPTAAPTTSAAAAGVAADEEEQKPPLSAARLVEWADERPVHGYCPCCGHTFAGVCEQQILVAVNKIAEESS